MKKLKWPLIALAGLAIGQMALANAAMAQTAAKAAVPTAPVAAAAPPSAQQSPDGAQMLVRARFLSVQTSGNSSIQELTKAAFAAMPGAEVNLNRTPFVAWLPPQVATSELPGRAFEQYGAKVSWGPETRFLSQGAQVWGSLSFPLGNGPESGAWSAPKRRFEFSLAAVNGSWTDVQPQWRVETENGEIGTEQAIAAWHGLKENAVGSSKSILIGYPNSRGTDWVILTPLLGRKQ